MSRQAFEALTDRWINEPEFRARMRRDPEGAVRATGAELDEEGWALVRAIDWNLPDDELERRISKAIF
jgi:hypothetical protein